MAKALDFRAIYFHEVSPEFIDLHAVIRHVG